MKDKDIIITAVVETITSDGYELMDCNWSNSMEEVAGPGYKYYIAGDELTITITLKRKL